jgi:hypothetical protein
MATGLAQLAGALITIDEACRHEIP